MPRQNFKCNLTAERVRERLNYDPATGVFTWRAHRCRYWVGRHAGTKAGGYLNIAVDKIIYRAHRLAWLHVYGEWPSGEIDHINRDRSDNRISNLREATRTQNRANYGAMLGRTHKGATYVARVGLWQAQIKHGNQNIYLGLFKTPEEASAAYLKKAVELHGEFAGVV